MKYTLEEFREGDLRCSEIKFEHLRPDEAELLLSIAKEWIANRKVEVTKTSFPHDPKAPCTMHLGPA